MRRSVLRSLGAAAFVTAIAQGACAQVADKIGEQITHGVPLVGVDIGAAFPISNFQKSASPGGTIAPYAGYEISVPFIEGFTFTPIFQPQFAGFGSCCGDDIWSMTSVMAGARFGLRDGDSQVYFGAEGGYYWNTTGPREHHSGNGFMIQGGYDYEFWRGIALGLFVRYDNAFTHPGVNTDSDTTSFVVTGLEAQYRFLPPPPAPPPPPPPVAQAAPPPVMKQKIVLRGVNFDFNKSDIRPDAAPILDQAAATLKEYGDVTVVVNGYTDSIGTDAYNERLSLRRAESVRAYLERRGVAAGRMTVKGFGKSDPVASNATAEGRAQNRRVELIVNQ
jgi:outer membrane protein OmpA-like peptidoglycan-associated protein